MYNSERMMKAIGDLSDDKIEKASRALGYQKERRQTSRIASFISSQIGPGDVTWP